ncbi:MAG: LptE family protein [Chitinophagaceae bacterium]|nr:LptE family protein [Chitinophagaceae bacterium]
MFSTKKISVFIAAAILITAALFGNSSCGIYKFNDASVPDSIKTVKVNFIENRATYVNPQLSPRLTDKLRQKIIGQTKLIQTNNEPDWEIDGTITQYSFSTSAITGQQAANNRLTVAVQMVLSDRKANKTEKIDVSRSFEFKGNQSFQQAENDLAEEMIRTLTDDIFNKLFSKW